MHTDDRNSIARWKYSINLFVNPWGTVVVPLDEFFLLKPQGNLPLSAVNSITSVADVTASLNAEVASDGARSTVEGVSGTQQLTSCGDSLQTFPDHGHNRSRVHVLDQASIERLTGQILVVFLQHFGVGMDHLHGHQLVTTLLETLDDVSHQTTLNTVRLDRDEGALLDVGHVLLEVL
ncbi:hypothetical protein RvY_07481 [Ramazzottius varieornatus]|uniref:Uncharacterized protein n=1 Tax=Ramazzottius varieornatus TaxID=947166 RepID=A0A1D1V2C0_RAMVA|nr:hypothetical protein RvY_07481 [Ramazzottius varieornatus]